MEKKEFEERIEFVSDWESVVLKIDGNYVDNKEVLVNFIQQELDKAREEGYKKGYIDGQIEKINKPKTVVSEFDKTSYLT